MHMISLMVIHVFPNVRGAHSVLLVFVAVLLLAAGIQVVRRSLTPFKLLRQKLVAVRTGKEQSVSGQYPTEVAPLVNDLNALLDYREQSVKRAFATAGDLAHGLKTPLALLAQEAETARATGNQELANSIAQQVDRMSRQINYHLSRARAVASGPNNAAACPIEPCVEALVRTLSKLYAARELQISANIQPNLTAKIRREDLDEILGNVLDNACKWTRTKVILAAKPNDTFIEITIDDDGPGLPPDQRAAVLNRGVRLDETTTGSGLGLAIVRDLANVYNGAISLEDSPLGGLRVRVSLPGSID